ncbi:hypothetical protein [Raoultella ornithinolytica]|uniref:hypothetical protein n=1 Tax=Raoultella ornithinolytica TaxID=54291 RepID=UPI003850C46B
MTDDLLTGVLGVGNRGAAKKMKIELIVDGRPTAECNSEAEFLAFQAAVFNALSAMQLTHEIERRERAKSKMARLNEMVFKTVPKDRNEADQEA